MSNVNPPNLGSIITSSAARKIIYGTYAIGVVAIGAFQVAFASAPELGGQPVWLTIALAFVAGYIVHRLAARADRRDAQGARSFRAGQDRLITSSRLQSWSRNSSRSSKRSPRWSWMKSAALSLCFGTMTIKTKTIQRLRVS